MKEQYNLQFSHKKCNFNLISNIDVMSTSESDICVQYLNGGLKTRLKKPVYGPKVWDLNGQPSHLTLPFEYWAPNLCESS